MKGHAQWTKATFQFPQEAGPQRRMNEKARAALVAEKTAGPEMGDRKREVRPLWDMECQWGKKGRTLVCDYSRHLPMCSANSWRHTVRLSILLS